MFRFRNPLELPEAGMLALGRHLHRQPNHEVTLIGPKKLVSVVADRLSQLLPEISFEETRSASGFRTQLSGIPVVVLLKTLTPWKVGNLLRRLEEVSSNQRIIFPLRNTRDLTRDVAVAEALGSFSKRWVARADSFQGFDGSFWVTLTRRSPTMVLISGPSYAGKTAVASMLNQASDQTTISGDSFLEDLARGRILASPALRSVCFEGLQSDDWSSAINEISNQNPLRSEFASILRTMSGFSNIFFEMYCPISLKRTILAEFTRAGYVVWRLEPAGERLAG